MPLHFRTFFVLCRSIWLTGFGEANRDDDEDEADDAEFSRLQGALQMFLTDSPRSEEGHMALGLRSLNWAEGGEGVERTPQ